MIFQNSFKKPLHPSTDAEVNALGTHGKDRASDRKQSKIDARKNTGPLHIKKKEISPFLEIMPHVRGTVHRAGSVDVEGCRSTIKNALKLMKLSSGNRILKISGIPPQTGIYSILSQVSGGPLEKVTAPKFTNSKPYDVYLHFMEPEHAAKFITFASTGRFLVNGNTLLPHISSSLSSRRSPEVYEWMTAYKARRTLVLTKDKMGTSSKIANNKAMIPPERQLESQLPLPLPIIRRDFGRYGEIIAVTPTLCRCFAVIIQYSDVRFAIKAKYDFDRAGADATFKSCLCPYSKDYRLHFTNDPTERTPPALLH